MYQITYQKRNGEVFFRIRNSLPSYSIGEETSMGWIIKDIKYRHNNNYYSYKQYKDINKKVYKWNRMLINIKKFFKRYSTTFALLVILPLYLIEII